MQIIIVSFFLFKYLLYCQLSLFCCNWLNGRKDDDFEPWPLRLTFLFLYFQIQIINSKNEFEFGNEYSTSIFLLYFFYMYDTH